MPVCHGGGKRSHSEDHTDTLNKTVCKRDGSSICRAKPHIMPGDSYIEQHAGNGKDGKKQSLSAIFPSGRAAEIFSEGKKQKKQEKIHQHDSVMKWMPHSDETTEKI